MYFGGDPSIRKRVDLGGKSSKERDRNKHVRDTRVAREQRQRQRLVLLSATKIQKCYRTKKALTAAQAFIRQQFWEDFGEFGEHADRDALKPGSKYLSQLLFFYHPDNERDVRCLLTACQLLLKLVKESESLVEIFLNGEDSLFPIVKYRIKHLAVCCLQAVHENRERLKNSTVNSQGYADLNGLPFLETVIVLTEPSLPWSESTIDFILQTYTFGRFREVVISMQGLQHTHSTQEVSCLEQLLTRLSSHSAKKIYDPQSVHLSFATQILSIPFLWKQFSYLKNVITKLGLFPYFVQQITRTSSNLQAFLPPDLSPELPSSCCLLGNFLEIAGHELCKQSCTVQMAMDSANVSLVLFEDLSHHLRKPTKKAIDFDEDMDCDDDSGPLLSKDLENQIFSTVESYSLELVRHLCNVASSSSNGDVVRGPTEIEVSATSAICAFLHVTLAMIPFERGVSSLGYKTELVPRLWKYMKNCHLTENWPAMGILSNYSTVDAPGWLLPLSVFCPVYRHMLMITDNEEFYEKQKPLLLQDIRVLVHILKEALWHLLWVIPSKMSSSQKPVQSSSVQKCFSVLSIQARVRAVAAELLAQLQDWNCRRPFIAAEEFHAREALDGFFLAQAGFENARVVELLRHAPFLAPFTTRVQMYTSQLAAARTSGIRAPFSRHRVRIRRNRIVDDAFQELSVMSAEELKGVIRVTFVNEFGEEEAGVDGGGLFKDFMENVTKTAFDIQYGLFKETVDHQLYPNPASAMIHPEHLEYFEFLGKILGKAMFEGILVDIPFAMFFLSKLKEKHNYLHDLPSLDPELYKNLLSLKHYEGDVSQLGLYFVSDNNEFGEQKEEELLPEGKDIQVTNSNIIMFIHLVANHRLNSQIKSQSSAFLRGFQQLIQPEWIDMFNEHELQLLISGSTEAIDVADLRANTNYTGGYSKDHPIIEMFWEVLGSLNLDHRKKFLKFVTGCSRGPLLGFKNLDPPFCIQRAAPEDASDEMLDRLPTSATCVNLLKLPPYKSKTVLEKKLMYAINAEAGFDLS